ncbi:MBOAT-domain-containing protein [Polychaeton citri CBS 116435]|uniref:MBOAT-domain-containing protein n=1 Tax=Polychaeton citri CBS 116435 TaxID=1314669 RepID=A0A9P4Q396_9PEZI|nr:MBOAT-domain-containing protein [Polychaeton citri CBS 116435]
MHGHPIFRLFQVETLDTRFGTKTGGQPLPNARPSKWNSPEYYFYYLCFLTIPFFMFKSVYDVSQPSHPNYAGYERLLDDGWIPGRKVDNSDAQYSGFRDNVPYLALLLIVHPLLRKGYEAVLEGGSGSPKVISGKATGSPVSERKADASSLLEADARMDRRIKFDLVFAAIYLFALHGVSAVKVFALLWINFKIATALPKQAVPLATWGFNIGVLFANELCQGYKFADLAAIFLPATTTKADEGVRSGGNWGARLDSYGGLIPRWEILFNICVLRLISFNFDYLWSLDRRAASPVEKKQIDPSQLSERDRVSTPAQPSYYSFRNYLAYILYSPLYLTGPILTFNDYMHQVRYPLPSVLSTKRTVAYAIRFLLCLLTMELCQHFLYAVAISKSDPDWSAYTPMQLSMLGYFNLHIIWLKLLLPWRFFRLWSLLDGIDPPENMIRCMSDNYSVMAFWRGWHRSYNQWIIRYIFIPLGGSRVSKPRAILNMLAVFTFVALWHDINLRLLVWGWLITLFVLPEAIATLLFPAKAYKDRAEVYRVLCGVGAVASILMLMAANLVGFAVGLDGLKGLVQGIVDSWGGRGFLLAACGTLFVGVQVMFEWRESEKRRGVDVKC